MIMGEAANTFISGYIAAWSAHDVPALLRHFAEDAVYADAALGVAKTGHEQIGAFMAFFFDCYHDVAYACRSALSEGDALAWEWTLTARYAKTSHTGIPANGQPIRIEGCSILRLRDGLIVNNTDYWNYDTMAKQIAA